MYMYIYIQHMHIRTHTHIYIYTMPDPLSLPFFFSSDHPTDVFEARTAAPLFIHK